VFVLDTSVAIELRDNVFETEEKVLALGQDVGLSILTRIEMEGGVHKSSSDAERRRHRLDVLLSTLPVMAFDTAAADAYRDIVAHAGFSRRKIVDRMIAAQALAVSATLVTKNGTDFRDIHDLKLLEW